MAVGGRPYIKSGRERLMSMKVAHHERYGLNVCVAGYLCSAAMSVCICVCRNACMYRHTYVKVRGHLWGQGCFS